MRYSLLAGGKRVRPVLCLATAEGFGCAAEDALPTALALELVHTFSLVHDDLPALDDDELRRGRPTAHVRYGEDIAVLAGDALLNHAFALVCDRQAGPDARRVAALRELTSAVGLLGMIGGQYRDVRPEDDLDASGLERTSRLKTGALLGAAAACGAIVAGAERARVATARAFGVELGPALPDRRRRPRRDGQRRGARQVRRHGRPPRPPHLRERAGPPRRPHPRRRERANGPRPPGSPPRPSPRAARGAREPGRDPRPLTVRTGSETLPNDGSDPARRGLTPGGGA